MLHTDGYSCTACANDACFVIHGNYHLYQEWDEERREAARERGRLWWEERERKDGRDTTKAAIKRWQKQPVRLPPPENPLMNFTPVSDIVEGTLLLTHHVDGFMDFLNARPSCD